MRNSREKILSKIDFFSLKEKELKPFKADKTIYKNKEKQFFKILSEVGGKGFIVKNEKKLKISIEKQMIYKQSKTIYSNFKLIKSLGFEEDNLKESVKKLDLAIVKGGVCVAENGAVWVTNEGVVDRLTYFMGEHLILFTSLKHLVNNMHEAYEKISFKNISYGLFISGPSKTADIEQSLVIGAHGPRSLTVYLIT